MALGGIVKGVKEALGTLAEEVTKEAPEQIKRVVPDEVKPLAPKEPMVVEEPISQIPMQKEQIIRDTRATYAKKAKVDEQVVAQDEILKKTELPEDADRMTMLQERQRNLFDKANNLKKQMILTEHIQKVKADGGSSLDSILDLVSNTPGVGKTFSNIEARSKAIYNRVNSDMFDVKEGLRTKWLGISQDRDLAGEVIRYLKDGTVKNQNRLAEAKLIGDQ